MKKLSLSALGLASIMALSACNAAEIEQPASSSDVAAASMTSQISKEEQRLLDEARSQFIAGENFLNQNKNATGVQTTASGLQYKVNKQGKGKSPKATDMVTVEYEGRLVNGAVFDSTAMHGNKPATFPLNGVIPGWTEGLQLMHEGSNFTFYIPANLAYGDQSPSPLIPAYSTLIFDVKLIKVGK